MSKGKITVGIGSAQREIEIIDFVQCKFKDNRLISVAGLEDGSMFLSVENVPSSGRAAQSNIWLSKESFLGVLSTSILYFGCKGEDLEKLLLDSANNEDVIDFVYSDNLKGL
jgi:hypothetical protein